MECRHNIGDINNFLYEFIAILSSILSLHTLGYSFFCIGCPYYLHKVWKPKFQNIILDAFVTCDKPMSSEGLDQAEILDCEVGLESFEILLFVWIKYLWSVFPLSSNSASILGDTALTQNTHNQSR